MRCQTEAGGVTGLELALSVFRQFRFQDVVQFLLDRGEVGFAPGLAYLTGQGIEGIQRASDRFVGADEFPQRGQQRREPAERHGPEVERVAVLIEEALLGAVIEGGGAWMDRNIGVRIGARGADLGHQRKLTNQLPAGVDDVSRQIGHHKVVRSSSGIGGEPRSVPFGTSKLSNAGARWAIAPAASIGISVAFRFAFICRTFRNIERYFSDSGITTSKALTCWD